MFFQIIIDGRPWLYDLEASWPSRNGLFSALRNMELIQAGRKNPSANPVRVWLVAPLASASLPYASPSVHDVTLDMALILADIQLKEAAVTLNTVVQDVFCDFCLLADGNYCEDILADAQVGISERMKS
jgi:hypothetical protein